MNPEQKRTIKQRLMRDNPSKPLQYVNRYGMTPDQIRKAFKQEAAPTRVAITTKPARTIKRPAKAIRGRSSQPNLLLEVPVVSVQFASLYPTPDWFTYKDKAEISVIVPMYKSAAVIKDQIDAWPMESGVEILYVDDACPANSKEMVLSTWLARKQLTPVGRIYSNSQNQGFATACNIGAYHATGDFLIFLNADTLVTPGWIRPIIRLLRRNDVGIVGNLQVKKGGQWDGYIDSAGSEWNWSDQSFLHIGRHTSQHKRLRYPIHPDQSSPYLLESKEREMVTGCCIGIRKSLYQEIGGFNPNYRIGYWEDADLCLTVREKGYKVMYQPNSKIYHQGSHTNSGSHKYADHNSNYFMNKWVNSGRIDPLVSTPRISPMTEVRSILLKRSVAHGDVLVAAAVAPALKKRYPNCKIIFNTSCPEVLEGNPYIEKVVDERRVSERSFQIYYNLDMAYEYRPGTNILEAYAEAVGVKTTDCELFLKREPYLELPEKYVVFHCGRTRWAGRDWPLSKFSILANRIAEMGYPIICVGTKNDYKLTDCIDLLGSTTIQQLAWVIANAKAFVGIDSFPMHVAQTFKTPGVCFFGSVDPKTRLVNDSIRPVTASGLGCLGCHHRAPPPCTATDVCETGLLDCVNMVSIDSMTNEIQKILEA